MKIKEWWNNFKEDLIFNLIMVGMTSCLIMTFIMLFIKGLILIWNL